jgi:hypothetical protein
VAEVEGLDRAALLAKSRALGLGGGPIKRHEPRVFKEARHLNMLADWIAFRLSGEYFTDPRSVLLRHVRAGQQVVA